MVRGWGEGGSWKDGSGRRARGAGTHTADALALVANNSHEHASCSRLRASVGESRVALSVNVFRRVLFHALFSLRHQHARET